VQLNLKDSPPMRYPLFSRLPCLLNTALNPALRLTCSERISPVQSTLLFKFRHKNKNNKTKPKRRSDCKTRSPSTNGQLKCEPLGIMLACYSLPLYYRSCFKSESEGGGRTSPTSSSADAQCCIVARYVDKFPLKIVYVNQV